MAQGLFATHRLVGREFCFWLMDLCILPLMLVVFVSWRCPRLVRELVLVWKDPGEWWRWWECASAGGPEPCPCVVMWLV